jgi:Ice-binding-like/MBG domain (YGX type)/Domain of unknown function (DUF4214)
MTAFHRNLRRIRRSVLTLEACEARILMASAPSLGVASGFAVLGSSTVTSTGATTVVGDVGVSPGTSIGLTTGQVTGTIYAGGPIAAQAEADANTAYNDLVGESADTILTGQNLGGMTLAPDVYRYASSAELSGAPLTFNANGNSNAVFVIQIGSTLTTGSDSSVILEGDARASNVFWQVGSSATIGTGTSFQGTLIAEASITLTTGVSIDNGRALALNGAVTMASNSVANAATPLTITPNAQTSVYGAAIGPLSASYNGFTDGDTSASLTTQPTLTTNATPSSPAGTYSIFATGAVDPNYTISTVIGTYTITQAPLTITADNQVKTSGAELPGLTASYHGFVNDQTFFNLTTPPTLSTTAIASSPAGAYPITAVGAVDPNYSIHYAAGTMTVTSGTISGTVYLDLNASGTLDAGEPGLAGRVVFLDLKHDGTLDVGDPTATTVAGGNFTLTNTTSGTGPVLEATAQDTSDRYVVDQSVTNDDGSVDIGVVPISPVAPVPVVPDPFSATPSSDANTAYVQSLYQALLGRVGASSEVNSWLIKMNSGMTHQEVAGNFVNSTEYRQDEVDAYYEDFLHRAPDPTSAFWVKALQSGVSEETVAEAILDSPEYQSAHPDSASYVANLYIDVLGRDGDTAGIAGWQAALTSGVSRETIVADFVTSAQANDQIVESEYTAFLHRPREEGASGVWENMLAAPNGSASTVTADILGSPEFEEDAVTAQAQA